MGDFLLASHNSIARVGADRASPQVLGAVFERYRNRLCGLVSRRMDVRLRRRLDPEDVVQDALVEALDRFEEFLRQPDVSFYVWLRFITCQKLLQLYRHHVGTKSRDLRREVAFVSGRDAVGSCTIDCAPAACLVSRDLSPGDLVLQTELRECIEAAFQKLTALDRQILALRHFDFLSNAGAAHVLGIDESAASSRYGRAMRKLRRVVRW